MLSFSPDVDMYLRVRFYTFFSLLGLKKWPTNSLTSLDLRIFFIYFPVFFGALEVFASSPEHMESSESPLSLESSLDSLESLESFE